MKQVERRQITKGFVVYGKDLNYVWREMDCTLLEAGKNLIVSEKITVVAVLNTSYKKARVEANVPGENDADFD